MSNDILFALATIVLVFIIVVVAGFGLRLVPKEKLVQDGAVLVAITGIVVCGMYFLHR